MNLKLSLKFLTYISRLQIILDVLNFNILFHMKGSCIGVILIIKPHPKSITLINGFKIDLFS